MVGVCVPVVEARIGEVSDAGSMMVMSVGVGLSEMAVVVLAS
jgi:hypothetical protein